jgi:hypothetical protein
MHLDNNDWQIFLRVPTHNMANITSVKPSNEKEVEVFAASWFGKMSVAVAVAF